ncbi:hypothetical protein ACFWGD_10755 [Corynebacterium sp. NPDC060344]|uniref:hypothetical protein n=1 Tax=Corynebacterium sp. NPDC060344 TaxID=3347101 RepID=UPI00365DEF60
MTTTETSMQTHPSGLILRRDQSDLGADEIRRRFRAGEMVRIARGIYIRRAKLPRHEDFRLRAAAAGLLHEGSIVTGPGAASLYGVATLYPPKMMIDVLSPKVDGTATSGFCRLRGTTGDEAAHTARGIRVTTPAVTAMETALLHGARMGLVVAESVLWAGRCTKKELADAYARTARRKGRGAARFVAESADDRSQSVGETLTYWCIRQAGLPEPLQQVEIVDEAGEFVAKVDFFWPEFGIIVEFDGDVKLSGEYGDPETVALKRLERDTALTNLGMRILHVKWAEVFSGAGAKTIREFFMHFSKLRGGYLGGWRLADLKR